MESKYTKEYAEKMAEMNNTVVSDTDLAYSNGYMKAIEENAVPDLLDVVKYISREVERLGMEDVFDLKFINNAIKKATKQHE